MPIYEYICPKCGTEFELKRPFSEATAPARCPKCNALAEKQFSFASVRIGTYLESTLQVQSTPKKFKKEEKPKAKGKKKK